MAATYMTQLYQRISMIFLLACLAVGLSDSSCSGQSITVDLGNGQSMELMRIPKGQFQMGAPESEESRKPDELRHPVGINEDFYLGKYPVTVGQFRVFVSETQYRTEAEAGASGGYGAEGGQLVQKPEYNWKNPGFPVTDQHPVTIVTLRDAQAFLAWLQPKAQRECLLPTEAQWEYACRAGSDTRFYNGDDETGMDAIGWHQKNSGNMPHPVGQKLPNAFGLHDMSGNVYEWCADIYNVYPPGAVIDPRQEKQPAGEPARNVLRGGSWMRLPERCRSAARYRATPGTRNAENGFRVMMSVDAINVASVQPLDVSEAPTTSQETPTSQHEETPGEHGNSHSSAETRSGVLSFLLWVGLFCGGLVVAAVVAAVVWSQLGKRHGTQAYPAVSPTAQTGTRRNRKGQSRTSESRKSKAGKRPNLSTGFRDLSGVTEDSLRLVDDGFWISGFPVGTNLMCSYWVMNQVHQITAQIESPDGQFVYTGDRPEGVEIVSIDQPEDEVTDVEWEGASWGSDSRDTTQSGTSPHTNSPPPVPDSSFPPAY